MRNLFFVLFLIGSFNSYAGCNELFKKNLEYYNKNSEKYVQTTQSVNIKKEYYDTFLKDLPENAHILDLGAGSGRDSLYFLNLGHQVTALEPSEELASHLRTTLALNVLEIPAQALSEVAKYDAIWAMASLLHVPFEELPLCFKNIYNALKDEGNLFISFKVGDPKTPRIDDQGRVFTDMDEITFKQLINEYPGLQLIEIEVGQDSMNRAGTTWLQAWLRKTSLKSP